ncbi:COGs COG2929 [hydrothermal vent metagenome]|uniref:COGs COG2929 n=1 Tax=hydrothermal vent metagenome TaxID=652676 RepID=A0A3B1AB05_9ZZZZ
MLDFEYDNNKSTSNLKKHGIDFISAQELWTDSELIELQVKSKDEPRFLVIGLIAKKHWSAVITYRGDAIRIISVRRSRKKEVELYES